MATLELTKLREKLNAIIETAAADLERRQQALAADIERREQAIAAAAEQLSQDHAVLSAWHEGSNSMRGRIVALIDQQRATLSRGGVNATCLETLRRAVLELMP